MLNEKGIRELAYVVHVNAIEPVLGSDNCEAACIEGWKVLVKKGEFKEGELGIYFEIDSKLPEKEPFVFLEKNHFRIKTQKYKFGGKNPDGFYSQGLIMHPKDFGWLSIFDENTGEYYIDVDNNNRLKKGDFLTEILGVTFYDTNDNKRKNHKSNPDAKYQRMMNRHPKFARSKFGRFCMKHLFMKKMLYLLFGGDKKNKSKDFPSWVKITDEERYQNISEDLYNKYKEMTWYQSEKIDGCSSTFTMKGYGKNREYLVCSRQIVKDINDKNGGYYDDNVWAEMHRKYNLEEVCADILDTHKEELEFVTLQGETYGSKIQKRDYHLKGHNLAIFNVIFGFKDGHQKRLNPVEMEAFMNTYSVPSVPVLGKIKLPDKKEELQVICKGASKIDGEMREGLVFRTEDGVHSFKAVDNDYLLKYHN